MQKKPTVSSDNQGFAIGRHAIHSSRAIPEALGKSTVPARPLLDASDVVVPEGYTTEVVMAGLSFPTDIAFIC